MNFKAYLKDSILITLVFISVAASYIATNDHMSVLSAKVDSLEAKLAESNTKLTTMMKDMDQKHIADEVKAIAVSTDAITKLETRVVELEQMVSTMGKKSK